MIGAIVLVVTVLVVGGAWLTDRIWTAGVAGLIAEMQAKSVGRIEGEQLRGVREPVGDSYTELLGLCADEAPLLSSMDLWAEYDRLARW